MSYSISVFRGLIEKYPSWELFQEYIISIGIRVVSSEDTVYRILRYVSRDEVNDDTRWFRSVVWNIQTNRPVCVSPPKSMEDTVPFESGNTVIVQDFVDGVMINAFFEKGQKEHIRLATRTQLDATGNFYSQRSFGELFMDSQKSFNDLATQIESHGGTTFASFILQHPEHRVVSKSTHPTSELIHVGSVDSDGLVHMNETVSTPYVYNNVLTTAFSTMNILKGAMWQGVVYKNGIGGRWKSVNPAYSHVRALRGNDALIIDRFLRLRKELSIIEYLKWYPEETGMINSMEDRFRKKTRYVYDAYIDVHKAKVKTLSNILKPYQPFVYRLHGLYITQLKPNGLTVVMKDVVHIVNNAETYEHKKMMMFMDFEDTID